MLDALTTLLEAGAAAPWVLRRRAGRSPSATRCSRRSRARASSSRSRPWPWRATARTSACSRSSPAVGAFLGDTLTFLVGRRYGPQRLARVTRPGARRVLERAAGTLERRGALVVLTARYVPLGRVAVNLTAGATGFPPRRFAGLAALAAATWAAWSVGVGALAGHWLDGNPLLGSAAGIALALGLGLAVDRVARRLTGWGRMPALTASVGAERTGPVAEPVA